MGNQRLQVSAAEPLLYWLGEYPQGDETGCPGVLNNLRIPREAKS